MSPNASSLQQLKLPAVQRGFATTSIPAKKAAATAPPDANDAEADVQPTRVVPPDTKNSSRNEALGGVDRNQESDKVQEDSWDNDEAVSTAAYQALMERLQDRGDKEVARIIKVRFSRQLLGLTRAVSRN